MGSKTTSNGRATRGGSPKPTTNWISGSVVALVINGTKMTVQDVGRDTGLVFCCWFTEDGVLHQGAFPAQALQVSR